MRSSKNKYYESCKGVKDSLPQIDKADRKRVPLEKSEE